MRPQTNSDVIDLPQLADRLLVEAQESAHGKASKLIITGAQQRAVLIALTRSGELAEHDSPPAATFHVLRGQARLQCGSKQWVVRAGELMAIPDQRHAVQADADCVILLTVSLDPPKEGE